MGVGSAVGQDGNLKVKQCNNKLLKNIIRTHSGLHEVSAARQLQEQVQGERGEAQGRQAGRQDGPGKDSSFFLLLLLSKFKHIFNAFLHFVRVSSAKW